MNKGYFEQVILFVSIVKWAILSTLVGVITGFSTTLFLSALKVSTDSVQHFQWYFLFLPLVFFASSFIVKYLAPDAEGHGTEKVIEAVHKRHGKIKLSVVPVKLAATVITLAGGGSAGKEGPCAQIGAGLASGVADVLRLDHEDRKKIVICGISAGFSTVFGTPIAGAIFAVEVLVLGRVLNEYLFPALVSALIGFETEQYLARFFPIPEYFHSELMIKEALKTDLYFTSIFSGIVFGLVALILIEALKHFEELSAKLKWWKPLKGILGGAMLVGLAFLFGKNYLGIGTEVFDGILKNGSMVTDNGSQVPVYAFLLKILFTAITLSFGGSGGILTPIFFIGVTTGGALAQVFGWDITFFAAIGLVAMLSAAANTPIAAMAMSIEMFGMEIAPYAAIACITSYIISGHRSVYPSQVIGALKSKSIVVPLNQEFRDVKTIRVNNDESYVVRMLKRHSFHH